MCPKWGAKKMGGKKKKKFFGLYKFLRVKNSLSFRVRHASDSNFCMCPEFCTPSLKIVISA